ncbi:MAG: PEP/pyruvate-binding domain-containing protein [Candidatus Eremiobacterota bacterium]
MKYFIHFQDIDSFSGGKAVNISILNKKGFTVPEGFCLSGKIYDEVLREYLTDFYLLPPLEQKNRLPFIKSFISDYKFSGNFTDELMDLISSYDGTFVVRSSCTMEDGHNYSFAGIYRSLLDVKSSPHAISEAIKSVWSSFWSDEAFVYRQERHITHRLNMAVIIQKQIIPDISGVIFTCNPMTGNDEVVINLTFNRIDELVSGKNIPFMMVIDKKSREIKEKTGNGICSDEFIAHLINLSDDVHNIFSCPQDIEWAYDKGQIYIFQARPVTSSGRWSRIPVCDFLPSVLTPLSADFFGNYLDERLVSFHQELGIKRPGGSLVLQYKGRIYINEYIYNHMWRILYDPLLFQKYFQAIWNMQLRLSLRLEEYRRKAAGLISAIEKSDDPWLLFLNIRDLMYREDLTFYTGYIYQIFNEYYKSFLPDELEPYKIFFQDFKPLDINLENYSFNKDLMELICRDGKSEYISEDLRNFIDRYGHWTDMPLELARKRYREDDRYILGMLGAMKQEDFKCAWERNKIEDKILKDKKIITEIKKTYEKYYCYPSVTNHFNDLLDLLVHLSDERERHRKYTLLLTEGLRKLCLYMGSLFVKRGFLEKQEDIFFLTVKEIELLKDLTCNRQYWRDHVRHVKKEYEDLIDSVFPDEFTGSIPKEVKPVLPERFYGMKIKGYVLNRGIVQGSARVIKEPEELCDFREGEILVVPGCEPCWSVVFPLALGMISETGGVLSHAAILAREYNIPGISGISGITGMIKTGDNIVLNCDEGWILIDKIELTREIS